MRFLHIGQLLNNGLFKKWVNGQLNDFEYNFMSWNTAFFEEFHRPGISLEKVVAFRAEYTQRMRTWKWKEHHFRNLRLRRMRLRRPLGVLRKQLSTLPDPTPQAVPVSAGTEELQRMAEWYKNSSSQYNREPLAPGSGSADRSNTNGWPGRGQRSKELWDHSWSAEGLSGVQ